MNGLDYFGCDDTQVGFDYGALLQTAGGLVQGGVNMYEQSEAEKKGKADAQKKLAAATAADTAAVAAVAKAAASDQLKTPTAATDAAAAKDAIAKQDAAGAALDDDGKQKRLDAAEKSLANVKKNAAANPKDLFQPILVKAWSVTVEKIKTGAGKDKDKAKNEESWLTRRVVGPLPGYAVVVGGVGIAGLLGFVVKRALS